MIAVASLYKGEGYQNRDNHTTGTTQSEGGTGFVDVTDQTVDLTTHGRPVLLLLTSIVGTNNNLGGNLGGTGQLQVIRDSATVIWLGTYPRFNGMPVIMLYDPVAAGTYNWKLQLNNNGGTSISLAAMALVAYELGT